MTRILVIDQHTLFGQCLAVLCKHLPRLRVTAQAESLARGWPMLKETDIVVIDADLLDGEDLVRAMRAVRPRVRVCALVGDTSTPVVADRVVSKAAGAQAIVRALSELGTQPRALAPRPSHEQRRRVTHAVPRVST